MCAVDLAALAVADLDSPVWATSKLAVWAQADEDAIAAE